MKLVIVESPTKAKTIGKILGSDFTVKSSVGHIRDLPKRSLGVDITHNFEPSYEVVDSHARVIKELVSAAKKSDEIYLAPDPDREGEAIAWHLSEVLGEQLGGDKHRFLRVSYNEITADAVRSAIENPREIDMALVDEQQARRILDRLVGYKVSPVLWTKLSRGLSAGRVQSVALRLICEREEKIRSFTPEAYWILTAKFSKTEKPSAQFNAKLYQIDGKKAEVKSEEDCARILDDLKSAVFCVKSVKPQDIFRRPYPPFITSTLQQAASTVYGFSPSQTMSLAQSLFEGVDMGNGNMIGMITYMRTDSVAVSSEARAAAAEFIRSAYGSEYVPERARFHKDRANAQAAHEAIRPTDPSRTPDSVKDRLRPREFKLYDLIWRRFIASQMSDAKIRRTTARIISDGADDKPKYTFSATAYEELFPGFCKVFGSKAADDSGDSASSEDDDSVSHLPPLAEGEPLISHGVEGVRKETKPPARYSEASLVKALDSNGIGRPSTYASILSTLMNRKYAAKSGKTLEPTALGCDVNNILVKNFPQLFNVQFTSQMEKELDDIGERKVEWREMISNSYGKLRTWLNNAKGPCADLTRVRTILTALEKIPLRTPSRSGVGARKFNDEKFVSNLARRMRCEIGEPIHVSDKQLNYLAGIASKYASRDPGVAAALRESGFGGLVDGDSSKEPDASTLTKFELIEKAGVPAKSVDFFNSLKSQALSGKTLTVKQERCLDRMFFELRDAIPGFSRELCSELGVEFPEILPEKTDSGRIGNLIAALEGIGQWDLPVKLGARTYDDSAFYASLTNQFRTRGRLSPAQIAALEKLVIKYREQIKDFEAFARDNSIDASAKPPKRRRFGARKAAVRKLADASSQQENT